MKNISIDMKECVKKHNKAIFACITIIFCAIYYLSYSVHNIPFTNGWGQEYAELCFNGQFPYRDFYYYLPPLNLIIDCILWKASFGYFFVYMILRLIERLVIVYLLYRLCCKFVSPKYACIGTIIGGFVLSATKYDVIGDYNQTSFLVLLLLIFSFFKYINCIEKNNNDNKQYIWLLICGIMFSFTFLIKQSLFLSSSIIGFIGFTSYFLINKKKNYFKSLLFIALGFIIVAGILAIVLLCNNALFSFIDQVYLQADSKGSIFSILFRFLDISKYADFIVISMLLLFLLFNMFYSKSIKLVSLRRLIYFSCIFLLVLLALYLVFNNYTLIADLEYMDFFSYINLLRTKCYLTEFLHVLISTINIFLIVKLIIEYLKEKDINVLKWLIALVGGLVFIYNFYMASNDFSSIYAFTINVALILCYSLDYYSKKSIKNIIKRVFIYVFCLIIMIFAFAHKATNTYTWFGWKDSYSTKEYKYSIDVKGLEGYTVTNDVKHLYELMYKVIDENSNEDSVIYGFPNIEIFNVLLKNYNTNCFVPIPHYDVCSSSYIAKDIESIKNNPPDIILWVDDLTSMKIHEKSYQKGERLEQRRFQSWLREEVNSGNYELIGQYNTLYIYKYKNVAEKGFTYIKDKEAINESLMFDIIKGY